MNEYISPWRHSTKFVPFDVRQWKSSSFLTKCKIYVINSITSLTFPINKILVTYQRRQFSYTLTFIRELRCCSVTPDLFSIFRMSEQLYYTWTKCMWLGTKRMERLAKLVFHPFLSLSTQILYFPSIHHYCISMPSCY